MTLPRCASVAALYALQNSMMLTPCCPSAGPIGGAGFAAPALIWSLIRPVTFFWRAMFPSLSKTRAAAHVCSHLRACARRGSVDPKADGGLYGVSVVQEERSASRAF